MGCIGNTVHHFIKMLSGLSGHFRNDNDHFVPFVSPQLKQLGHSVDKVEFIVMGGTFMALPEDYRDFFIRNLHDALSGHTSNNVSEAVR